VADPLLAKIEKFLRRRGMAASTFGREVMGDPGLVRQMRSGRSVTLRTEKKIRDYLEVDE
jgi:hypothetical protein